MKPITFQPFLLPSAAETRDFLTNHTITDDELMRELWNSKSGLPGLLSAHTPDTITRPLRRGEREYTYNPATGRYRRVATDRVVSEAELRRAVRKVSADAKNRIRETTKQMMAGTILFMVWYHRTRSTLKALYRSIWTVAFGGALFEDQDVRNLFYLWSIVAFDKFDALKIAIETGAMLWNGHIRTAAGNFAGAGNGMYQNAKLDIGRRKGHDEARRVLGENENHCIDSPDRPGCIELAELGWVSISRMVPIGAATCRDNCMCQIETRKRPNA